VIVTALLPVPIVTGNSAWETGLALELLPVCEVAGLEPLPAGCEVAGLEPLPAGCEVAELEQPAVASSVAATATHAGIHQRFI
jgi:hypothetical protein